MSSTLADRARAACGDIDEAHLNPFIAEFHVLLAITYFIGQYVGFVLQARCWPQFESFQERDDFVRFLRIFISFAVLVPSLSLRMLISKDNPLLTVLLGRYMAPFCLSGFVVWGLWRLIFAFLGLYTVPKTPTTLKPAKVPVLSRESTAPPSPKRRSTRSS